MDEVRMVKRLCGHESPFTFKKNERFGRQRFAKFMATKCPECTVKAIQELEAKQKAEAQRVKDLKKRIAARKAAEKQQAEKQKQSKPATEPPAPTS